MKKKISVIVVALLLLGLQFYLANIVSNYKGTDDQAVGLIHEIAPNYTPWANYFWEPSNEWSETLLFAFQTVLGLSVLVYFFIKRKTKLKTTKC